MNLLMLSSCHVHVCMCMRIYLRHFLCPSSVCLEFMPRQLHRSGCFDPEAAPYIACILYIYLRNQQQHSNCESPLEVVWHCGFAVQPTLIYSIMQHSPYISRIFVWFHVYSLESYSNLCLRCHAVRRISLLVTAALRPNCHAVHGYHGLWPSWHEPLGGFLPLHCTFAKECECVESPSGASKMLNMLKKVWRCTHMPIPRSGISLQDHRRELASCLSSGYNDEKLKRASVES